MDFNPGQATKMVGKAAKAVKKPPVKDAGQLKKEAKAQAKKRGKALLKVALAAALVAAVGLGIYLVKFYGRQPKDALEAAIGYAYKDNVLKFRDAFTSDSVALVEGADGDVEQAWEHLMDGITPSETPKILRQDITENNDIKSAEVTVMLDGEERQIYMRQEDGAWKINLNVAINPRKVVLPDDVPPEYVDNFAVPDGPEAWWEEDSDKPKDGGTGNGILSKLQFWKHK